MNDFVPIFRRKKTKYWVPHKVRKNCKELLKYWSQGEQGAKENKEVVFIEYQLHGVSQQTTLDIASSVPWVLKG